jgi:alpha-tubulin suppressor-like RCC1 family protein
VDDGTSTGVKCWGRGSFGQLGDGTKDEKKLPGADVIKNLSSVKAVSAGVNHSCALKTDGTVACWGLNDQGQLGNGRSGNRNIPVKVTGFKSE